MANIQLRRQALELRKLGMSYNQIRDELGVSKSTLSGWLKEYPLSQEQIRLLRDSHSRIERFRQTMLRKRETRLLSSYNEAKDTLLPLTKRELFLAGLFLYWGEGGKTERGLVTISNTDPGVLKFSLYWMVKGMDITKDKIRVLLHLYNDMNVEESIDYWSKTLNIAKSQFVKPYIKISTRTTVDYKGFGHGTCMLRVGSTLLKEKILMSMKVMADYAEETIPEL
jgi:predicted transcriptional regulator